MSLKDISRNGHVVAGAFTRKPTNDLAVPIIGKSVMWQRVGFVQLMPPEPTEAVPAPPWVLMLGGERTDGKLVTAAVSLVDGLTVTEVVERIGRGLQYLQTYRSCSCPNGTRCAEHPAPKTDDSAMPVVTEK